MNVYKVKIRLMYPDWGSRKQGKMESKKRAGIVISKNLKKAIEKTKQTVYNYAESTNERIDYEILSIEHLGTLITEDGNNFFYITSEPI